MDDGDKKAFRLLMSTMTSTFRVEATVGMEMGYWVALQDLAMGDVQRAAVRAMAESKFMPTPRELRDLTPKPPPLTVVNPAMERLLAPFLRQEEWPDEEARPKDSECVQSCLRNADEAAMAERRARKAYASAAPGTQALRDARTDIGRYHAEHLHWLEYAEWYRKQQRLVPGSPRPSWMPSQSKEETEMDKRVRQRLVDMETQEASKP